MMHDRRFRVAGATHTGMKRRSNEDAFKVDEGLGLMIVADGVGGRPGGDVAAKIAVDCVHDFIAHPETTWPAGGLDDAEEAALWLLGAFTLANDRIRKHALRHERLDGMATTLVTGLLLPRAQRWVVVHVGDSRAYLHRRGGLDLITLDHTLANDEPTRSRLRPELVAQLPPSLLTRAVGLREHVAPDVHIVDLAGGDLLALATDGLSAVLGEAEIAGMLDEHQGLGAAVEALIDRVNAGGGPDNVTVCLGRWTRV